MTRMQDESLTKLCIEYFISYYFIETVMISAICCQLIVINGIIPERKHLTIT